MRFRRLCAAVLLAASIPVPAAHAASVTCEDVNTPISMGLLGGQQTMYGRLCVPQGATTVQVLVPGGTYTSSYWDIPIEPELHSFRRSMNNAGFATLAVDRIGTGRSSKPLSLLINSYVQADAVHQVIQQKLRPRFQRVLVGGHSIGSVVAMVVAGTYRNDADGVLITGMTHQWDYLRAAPALTKFIPVALDPKWSKLGVDPAYMTSMPGSRYELFHKPGLLSPVAAEMEETTKDIFAPGELLTTAVLSNIVLPISLNITAPVMTVQTSADYFCGTPPLGADCSSAAALKASEGAFYPNARSMAAYVINGYGHCFNYAPSAPQYHAAVISWARSLG